MRFMAYGFFLFQALALALALGYMMTPWMGIEGGGNLRQWLPLVVALVVAVPNITIVRMLVDKGPCKRCSDHLRMSAR